MKIASLIEKKEYKTLEKDYAQNSLLSISQIFKQDKNRVEKRTLECGDFLVDFSKNTITDKIFEDLIALANSCNLKEKINDQFAGVKINSTENRSVLHSALRRPRNEKLVVDGVDVVKEVWEVLDKMALFCNKVLDGSWTGATGKKITDIVNIGIGGSDLGPAFCAKALQSNKTSLKVHFVSNVDPCNINQTLMGLNPETCLFVIVSKTWTTLETITNAKIAKTWILKNLQKNNMDPNSIVEKHFVAVSTALNKVKNFGIDPQNSFGFWDWVGGRYSVDSAVGLSLMLAIGPKNFYKFLEGFNKVDKHFTTTPFEKNVPVLMGLMNIWFVNFCGYNSHAILPYSQNLSKFPAYLQQLAMESNGKQVQIDGKPANYKTGEIFWGEAGTNGQHAFYQLLHQGTQIIPCDFIGFINSTCPTAVNKTSVQDIFMANFFAQSAALAFGKSKQQVEQENVPQELINHKIFLGNRPSTTLLAKKLTPETLGSLIAIYEHIVFVQGIIWNINSFDQWGVELGKQLAQNILPLLENGNKKNTQNNNVDSSTKNLVKFYKKEKE